jgi:hypothetical protein
MKLFNVEESQNWLTVRSFRFSGERFEQSRYLYPNPSFHKIAFTVPKSPQLLFQLSALLTNWLSDEECLLWASEWNPFYPKQLEDYCNFRSEAENTLIAYPSSWFNLSSLHDRALLKTNSYLFLSFNWEGFVVSGDSSQVIWLADEVVEIRSKEVFPAPILETVINIGSEVFMRE